MLHQKIVFPLSIGIDKKKMPYLEGENVMPVWFSCGFWKM